MRRFALIFFGLAALVTTTVRATGEFEPIETGSLYFPESAQQFGVDLLFVPVSYPNYAWVGDQTSKDTGMGIHLGLEWMPFDPTYGKIGIGIGTSFQVIRNVNFGGTNATLTVIPIDASLSYRFDYIDKQILVPFIKGGVTLAYAKQRGIEKGGYQSYFGSMIGGGLELCLNHADRNSARYLDRQIGINATYLLAEYVRSRQLGQKGTPNLDHDEIRFGLRFEL